MNYVDFHFKNRGLGLGLKHEMETIQSEFNIEVMVLHSYWESLDAVIAQRRELSSECVYTIYTRMRSLSKRLVTCIRTLDYVKHMRKLSVKYYLRKIRENINEAFVSQHDHIRVTNLLKNLLKYCKKLIFIYKNEILINIRDNDVA